MFLHRNQEQRLQWLWWELQTTWSNKFTRSDMRDLLLLIVSHARSIRYSSYHLHCLPEEKRSMGIVHESRDRCLCRFRCRQIIPHTDARYKSPFFSNLKIENWAVLKSNFCRQGSLSNVRSKSDELAVHHDPQDQSLQEVTSNDYSCSVVRHSVSKWVSRMRKLSLYSFSMPFHSLSWRSWRKR